MGKPNKIRIKSKRKISKTKSNEHSDYDEIDDELEDDFIEDEKEISSKWYEELGYVKLDPIKCSEDVVRGLHNEAETILEEEIQNYRSSLYKSKNADTTWMLKAAKTGTSSDKIAALTLIVQQSPIHNVGSLRSLINMAKVSKKSQFILAIDTLAELFVSDLLRPGKRLRKFNQQHLGHLDTLSNGDESLRKKRLCYWLFEDTLKALYEQFVTLLNSAAHDTVPSNREKAIVIMSKLLLGNREQEEVLINNLINKLGDPVHKVASKVVHSLEKVTMRYPELKKHLLEQTEKMLFRPHISQRAQYYGICFLCQFKYTRADKQLAKNSIIVYFSFFKACVKTGTIDSRMMGALLVGVNRAYPFAASRKKKSDPIIPIEHVDTVYKVVHLAPFKIGLQALALLLQISNSDRFYNALYRKLLDKELLHTSHQKIWLHLVFKALRRDNNLYRVKSFVKRILQICQYFPIPLACGTLFMLSQLTKKHSDLFDKILFSNNENQLVDTNDSSKESFTDNDKNGTIAPAKKYLTDDAIDVSDEENNSSSKPSSSSWYHRNLLPPLIENPSEENPVKERKPRTAYDPLLRNPAFAGGECAVFSELVTLTRHYHPSVALFAKTILHGGKIRYSGDPLADFTLIRFLERFSFKNPKKPKDHGDNENEQQLFRSVGAPKKHYNPKNMKTLPVQSDKYLNQSESAIPVDERFLYNYLRDKRDGKMKEKQNAESDEEQDENDSDVESVGSVEFNEYLDNLVGKRDRDLDFAGDVDDTKRSNKGKKLDSDANSGEDENELDIDDEDMDDGDNLEDEEADESGNENESEDDDDEFENEDAIEFSDDDAGDDEKSDQEFDESDSDGNDTASLQKAIRKKIGNNFRSMAMSTEEFSSMLEEAGKKKSGGLHDVFNKDNASDKQLRWEQTKTKQDWKNKQKRTEKRSFGGHKNKQFRK